MKKGLFVCLTFFILTNTLYSAPSSEDVTRELSKLIGKKSKVIKKQTVKTAESKSSSTWDDIGNFFSKLWKFIKTPAGIIIIIVFILLIYFLVKKGIPYFKGGKTLNNEEYHSENTPYQFKNSFQKLYENALQQAKKGNHDVAIIFLHKATVEYLKDHLMISPKLEYTNNELKKITKKKEKIYIPFKTIIFLAEIASFSWKHLNKIDYENALNHFEMGFLGK